MKPPFKEIEQTFGSAVQLRSFGKSSDLLVEVEATHLLEVATWLRLEESFRVDRLETLSVFEFEEKLVFSYFLFSGPREFKMVLRASAPLPSPNEKVKWKSVTGVWTQAEPFESEITTFFGVEFDGFPKKRGVIRNFGNWDGYPMRRGDSFGDFSRLGAQP